MSAFDPEAFMRQETTEQNETRFEPVPEGEFVAMVDDLVIRNPKDSVIADISWEIKDEELRARLGMDDSRKILVRQSIFLDVEESGALSFGPNKNVQLGKLRSALGQNESGQPWSFEMLKGAGPAKIKVIQDPDKNDPETIWNRVTRVTKLVQ